MLFDPDSKTRSAGWTLRVDASALDRARTYVLQEPDRVAVCHPEVIEIAGGGGVMLVRRFQLLPDGIRTFPPGDVQVTVRPLDQDDHDDAQPAVPETLVEIELLVQSRSSLPTARCRAPAGFAPDVRTVLVGHRHRSVPTRGKRRRDRDWRERYPRTGRLFRQEGALRTWRDLRIGIVGCGRAGSGIAFGLAATGVASDRGDGEIAICDADALEPGNLDGMQMDEASVGRLKVHAVADELRRRHPSIRVTTLVDPVGTEAALAGLARCDVLVVAADEDRARIQAGWAGMQLMQTVIDLGTGAADDLDRFGADVRVILPGRAGCLLCLGGIAGDLSDARSSRPGDANHAINQIAGGVAMQMLMGVVSGQVRRSRWLRLTLDARGVVGCRSMRRRRGACAWCGG